MRRFISWTKLYDKFQDILLAQLSIDISIDYILLLRRKFTKYINK